MLQHLRILALSGPTFGPAVLLMQLPPSVATLQLTHEVTLHLSCLQTIRFVLCPRWPPVPRALTCPMTLAHELLLISLHEIVTRHVVRWKCSALTARPASYLIGPLLLHEVA